MLDAPSFDLFKRTCFHSSVYILTVFDVDHGVDFYSTVLAPFDAYSLTAFAFVIEKATNTSVPILAFAVGDAPGDFVISSVETKTVSGYTYDSGTGPTTIGVHSSMVWIEARRSQIAQAFTMCLLLINWALTVGSIYIMLIVVFRRGGINEAVLLLPVTIILTIPTLRSLYAGSPPFGIFIGKSGAYSS